MSESPKFIALVKNSAAKRGAAQKTRIAAQSPSQALAKGKVAALSGGGSHSTPFGHFEPPHPSVE